MTLANLQETPGKPAGNCRKRSEAVRKPSKNSQKNLRKPFTKPFDAFGKLMGQPSGNPRKHLGNP